MRMIRTETPQPETWDWQDVQQFLNCDEMKAKQIMEDYHKINGGGYGEIEKHLILDFIEQKQRAEREREARYKADIASVETVAVLKEQVKTLKEQIKALKEQDITLKEQVETLRQMCQSSSEDAHKARFHSIIAYIISGISATTSIIALVLSLINI